MTIGEARAVLATARENPQLALESAAGILDRSEESLTRATAHFALGLAHRTLANGTASTEHFETARALAADDQDLLGQILRSLAFNYAQAGHHALADTTVAESIRLLTGQEMELSRLQQAFMLLMRGEHRAALPVLTSAIDGFTRSGDEEYLALTLYNRALVHLAFGNYDGSIEDLERAYDIGVRLGNHASAADAALHLSQVLGWRDDVPGAMQWHARSVELRAAAGADSPVAEVEHAFVLVQARLLREAEEILTTAIPRLEDAGDNEAIAIAGRLVLADVLIERGDHEGALAQVEMAASQSPADGRWRFDIAATGYRARTAAGEVSRDLLDSMLSTAADMEANGERNSAAVERLRAVEIALDLGDHKTAKDLCSSAPRTARSGPLWLQIQAWTALAQVRYAGGDKRGAASAARAGMRRLDLYRSGIGATDLRLHAAELGTKLARIGIRVAVESASVTRVLEWSERLRTSATAPATREPEIEHELIQLRRAAARARNAGADTFRDAHRALQTHEARVRNLSHQARGARDRAPVVSLPDLQQSLAARTLIEFVDNGAGLLAIVVDSGSARIVDLGPAANIGELVDHLRFSAERIARPSTSAASRTAAIASAAEARTSLQHRLAKPIDVATPRVVTVPTGALHNVPMTMLFDLPVETAPSATAWRTAHHAQPRIGRPLVSCGPGLLHAAAEAAEIATIAGGRVTSNVEEAIAGLDGASLAHFACHARPRVDSPMFSSLVLDDGELTLYDIERLRDVPGVVVLAACAGGATVQASGEEVLSLAGSFLSIGARTVIAPLYTVSDKVTATVMRAFHRSLAAGGDPAAALLAARQDDDESVALTAGSFVCFGAS